MTGIPSAIQLALEVIVTITIWGVALFWFFMVAGVLGGLVLEVFRKVDRG